MSTLTTAVPYTDELAWPEGMRPFQTVDLETQKDPFAHYAWMREHAPVLRTRANGKDVWFISRYDDVRAALRAPKVFSSTVVDPIPLVFLTLFDPPEHNRLRQVVASSFTPKAVAVFEDSVRAYAAEYLDELLAAGGGDVVDGFALRITMATISSLLGVPATDFDQMKYWSDDVSSYFGQVARQAPPTEGAEEGAEEFFAYLLGNIERARRDDNGSVGAHIGRLLQDGVLTEREAKHFCAFLFVAGHETTTVLLANAFREFSENPGLLERIRNTPTDAKAFVEEMARYRGTVQRLSRKTVQDAEVAGVTIPAGDVVILLPGSANRDHNKFDNGDVFDIDRDTSGHLGFGHGIHSCLGQHLARLEGAVGVELIAKKVAAVTARPDNPIQFVTGGNLANTGPSYFPVDLVPVGDAS
ncbi:cytochrome P450 [Georgenia subflava]|uniref:Cytochrome P450 n=1 Tax=Georgenia subflava TaxID=1622177 RepID=A0A6N7EFV9_9MICO|nr:cytochrome P450 [Georgenia subflava]MPV35557.1 cytochrome P450 [Georgenia subflava]